MPEETSGEESIGGADEEKGKFGRAKEFVGEQYTKASSAVRDGYKTVREKVDDVDFEEIVDQMRGYVRSHPGKALLISVGIGFIVGLLLRRDSDDDR